MGGGTLLATSCIELVSPRDETSPIWNLMKKYRNIPYHLCFECPNLEEEVQRLRSAGWRLFQAPAPAPAIGGKNVVFLMQGNAGIIELVESE